MFKEHIINHIIKKILTEVYPSKNMLDKLSGQSESDYHYYKDYKCSVIYLHGLQFPQ